MTSDVMRGSDGAFLASNTPEVDFALVLSRVIDSVQQNPAELRNAVYEVARIKLQREAWNRDPPLGLWEMRRLTIALETAIDRVEALSQKQDQLRALQSLDRLIEDLEKEPARSPEASAQALLIDHSTPADDHHRHLTVIAHVQQGLSSLVTVCRQNSAAPLRRVSLLVLLLLAAYGLFYATSTFLRTRTAPAELASTSIAPSAPPDRVVAKEPAVIDAAIPDASAALAHPSAVTQKRNFPLPTAYGIYAINENELHELEALPGKAPNQRIFMSAPFSKPSRTTLSSGPLSFIAFRRDLATNAPDRVSIRVVAQVKRAMVFDATGRANNANVRDVWAMRNVSYDFRVTPIKESPEMLLIQPETSDFMLSPGRYAMVLNGVGYDFTIDGEPTDPAQCLERTQAANGTFYSECRKP